MATTEKQREEFRAQQAQQRREKEKENKRHLVGVYQREDAAAREVYQALADVLRKLDGLYAVQQEIGRLEGKPNMPEARHAQPAIHDLVEYWKRLKPQLRVGE